MIFKKKLLAASFTLTGAIIGAGILGLPYVFSKSGYLLGFSWLIFLGIIMTYIYLCLGEVTLRTKEFKQLPGLAKKYLGKKSQIIMLFAVLFGMYSALTAYLIGEGESLSQLITGNTSNAIYFSIGFWAIMSLILKEGMRGLKKVETWGVLAIITLLIIITMTHFPQIEFQNLKTINNSNWFIPFGVILFALMGFPSIPEIRLMIKGSEKKFKLIIFVGVLIPMIAYALFSYIFVGVLGTNIAEVATLGFGKLVTLLGIFTMLTSYFVLSFSMKDLYKFDLNFSKTKRFFLVTLLPIIIYLILYFLDKLSFITILGIGGIISGGIAGILILFISLNAKKKGNRKPEYEMPINLPIIILISLIFAIGVIIKLV